MMSILSCQWSLLGWEVGGYTGADRLRVIRPNSWGSRWADMRAKTPLVRPYIHVWQDNTPIHGQKQNICFYFGRHFLHEAIEEQKHMDVQPAGCLEQFFRLFFSMVILVLIVVILL
jgi:hypothetical protein